MTGTQNEMLMDSVAWCAQLEVFISMSPTWLDEIFKTWNSWLEPWTVCILLSEAWTFIKFELKTSLSLMRDNSNHNMNSSHHTLNFPSQSNIWTKLCSNSASKFIWFVDTMRSLLLMKLSSTHSQAATINRPDEVESSNNMHTYLSSLVSHSQLMGITL